tara:strand:+ start:926 stop:1090 length:165 start_codon:yes stop_codon:yes gene_type:complete
MQITKQEMEAIISLAKKIIEHQSETKWNKQIRQSEDTIDYEGARAPEKCEDCND